MILKTMTTAIPEGIFRAYDIRGRYPAEVNEEIAAAIARAFVVYLRPWSVVLGRDVRKSGDKLFPAVRKALVQSGVNVVDIGIVPAEVFYYAVATEDADGGVFISASHNGSEWNGLRLTRREAEPISSESGLKEIYALTVSGASFKNRRPGKAVRKNVVPGYLGFIRSFISANDLRPMTLALNGNFGVSAELFESFVQKFKLPLKLVSLNAEPDGNFPKGAPNPMLEENWPEFSKFIIKKKADLGIAWDGDGDQVFFADEAGKVIDGYFTMVLLVKEILVRSSGGTIVTDPRLIWPLRDITRDLGGRLIVNRAGPLLAERMRKEGAYFAGEMTGHFYFRETLNRDSSFLAILNILKLMSRENKKLSALVAPLRKKYFSPGEFNFPLKSQAEVETALRAVAEVYADGKIERIDGLSVEYPTWRFNLRPSKTEPLLRLNMEAKNKKILVAELAKFKKLRQLISEERS